MAETRNHERRKLTSRTHVSSIAERALKRESRVLDRASRCVFST